MNISMKCEKIPGSIFAPMKFNSGNISMVKSAIHDGVVSMSGNDYLVPMRVEDPYIFDCHGRSMFTTDGFPTYVLKGNGGDKIYRIGNLGIRFMATAPVKRPYGGLFETECPAPGLTDKMRDTFDSLLQENKLLNDVARFFHTRHDMFYTEAVFDVEAVPVQIFGTLSETEAKWINDNSLPYGLPSGIRLIPLKETVQYFNLREEMNSIKVMLYKTTNGLRLGDYAPMNYFGNRIIPFFNYYGFSFDFKSKEVAFKNNIVPLDSAIRFMLSALAIRLRASAFVFNNLNISVGGSFNCSIYSEHNSNMLSFFDYPSAMGVRGEKDLDIALANLRFQSFIFSKIFGIENTEKFAQGFYKVFDLAGNVLENRSEDAYAGLKAVGEGFYDSMPCLPQKEFNDGREYIGYSDLL